MTIEHEPPSGAFRAKAANASRLVRRDWIWAVVFAIAAGLLRIALSEQRGFWLHEYYTLNAIQMDVPSLVENRVRAGHSPLPFLYEKIPLAFTDSKIVLRATSAVWLSATILLITGLLGSFGLRRHLPVFWVLSLFSPFWLTIGMELRYMMMLTGVASAAAWAASTYVRDFAPRRGIVLAALLALLLWIHSSAQFVSFALIFYVVWERMARGRRRWEWTLFRKGLGDAWPAYVGLVSSLPFLFLARGHAEDSGRNWPNPGDLVKNLCESAFGYFKFWFTVVDFPYYPWLALMVAVLGWAIWATRRELLRENRLSAWRLIASIFIGIPVAVSLSAVAIRDVQGHIRYVVCLAIPATICLAVAWNAEVAPRARAIYRFMLVFIFVAQFAGAALNRGDRHEETAEWVLANRRSGDPLVLTSVSPNVWAFDYLGCKDQADYVLYDGTRKEVPPFMEKLRETFGPAEHSKGFIVRYHGHAPAEQALTELKETGFLAGYREWEMTDLVKVFAVARDPSELIWLDALTGPPMRFGPSRTEE